MMASSDVQVRIVVAEVDEVVRTLMRATATTAQLRDVAFRESFKRARQWIEKVRSAKS